MPLFRLQKSEMKAFVSSRLVFAFSSLPIRMFRLSSQRKPEREFYGNGSGLSSVSSG